MFRFGQGERPFGLDGGPLEITEVLEDESQAQVELTAILTLNCVGHGESAFQHRHGFSRPPQAVKGAGKGREGRHSRRRFTRFDPRSGCGQPCLPLGLALF